MNNIQLELALKEAQKQIITLEQKVVALESASSEQVAADVRRLEDITRRAFRSAGLSYDWNQAELGVKKTTAAPVTPQQVQEEPVSTAKLLRDAAAVLSRGGA